MRCITGEQCLMRIFIGESDRYQAQAALPGPRRTSSGPTASPEPRCCAASQDSAPTASTTPTSSSGLSCDLPVIVEVIESRDRIDEVMPEIYAMMNGGLVTLEKVEVVRYCFHGHEGE